MSDMNRRELLLAGAAVGTVGLTKFDLLAHPPINQNRVPVIKLSDSQILNLEEIEQCDNVRISGMIKKALVWVNKADAFVVGQRLLVWGECVLTWGDANIHLNRRSTSTSSKVLVEGNYASSGVFLRTEPEKDDTFSTYLPRPEQPIIETIPGSNRFHEHYYYETWSTTLLENFVKSGLLKKHYDVWGLSYLLAGISYTDFKKVCTEERDQRRSQVEELRKKLGV